MKLRPVVLSLLVAAGMNLSLVQAGSSPDKGVAAPPRLQAAARTFAIAPAVGSPSTSSAGELGAHAVYGDIKSTIVLFRDGEKRVVFFTSAFRLESMPLQTASRNLIAEVLGIEPQDVVINSAHNHSIPRVDVGETAQAQDPRFEPSRALGREFMAKLRQAAEALPGALEPVWVKWGVAQEDRLTYNRRGRRADGTSYFIREEDRLQLPPDYKGTIDPDATLVLLEGQTGPVACLAWYTGHPVTVYDPENPVAFGEWPQVACEIVSEHLGGVPVAFFQGCAGDINSKYMFSGTIEQSREFGRFLGDAYLKALRALQTSRRDGIELAHETVDVPLAGLPDRASVEQSLAEIDAFWKRAKAGDPDTLTCVGLNFPKALEPPYRAWLVEPPRRWYAWALQQHVDGKADQVATAVPLEIVVARIGDVGFVGMPAESFVRTGLKIKREAALPCVIPCGYTGQMHGYIPDASACDDREYMAGNYRYRAPPYHAPYRAPGGDAMAISAVRILNRMAQ
ncbi:MAG: hypothetical protein JNG83_10210 [Opitutaceae bacterium]|nr:hypothetical protein [Opitutaceae bacterium]